MIKRPLVSIALCTFNGARYLEQQLESLINQTYRDLEIICVDDGSSDNTFDILHDFSLRFSHVYVTKNKENLGYIKNFEKAISLCTGEYIALCDQDDIWDPQKIELLVSHIGEHQLIYHDSEFINEDGTSLNLAVSDVCNFYRGGDSRHFLLENCVSGHASLFKKALVPYLIPFPESVHHDWWLAYIACNHGSIDFVNNKLVKYRQHSSTSTDILRIKGNLKKYKESDQKITKEAERTEVFANRSETHSSFTYEFVELLYSRMSSFISLRLFFFLLRNHHFLLYMQKKSIISKLNFCFRFSWGYRIKNIF